MSAAGDRLSSCRPEAQRRRAPRARAPWPGRTRSGRPCSRSPGGAGRGRARGRTIAAIMSRYWSSVSGVARRRTGPVQGLGLTSMMTPLRPEPPCCRPRAGDQRSARRSHGSTNDDRQGGSVVEQWNRGEVDRLRVYVSNVRMPRSHTPRSGCRSRRGTRRPAATRRWSSRSPPSARPAGRLAAGRAGGSCMFRAPICRTSAYPATRATSVGFHGLGDDRHVEPVAASRRSAALGCRVTWKEYGVSAARRAAAEHRRAGRVTASAAASRSAALDRARPGHHRSEPLADDGVQHSMTGSFGWNSR